MPFSLTNAPATFQSLKKEIFKEQFFPEYGESQLREQQRQYREPGIIFCWNIVVRDIEIKLIREPETPGLEHFWAVPETNNEEPLNGGVDFGSLSELPLRCHFCSFE
ncbi:hypothetical protein Adt_06902 [Abeliophyllum distichum]|uniref:Uncharacterized protein n=1 Tax=Abeliophyllum distichum TaxID=126358 RepID=A0ABD1V888_9LAMI